jgi:hypothetical protein
MKQDFAFENDLNEVLKETNEKADFEEFSATAKDDTSQE